MALVEKVGTELRLTRNMLKILQILQMDSEATKQLATVIKSQNHETKWWPHSRAGSIAYPPSFATSFPGPLVFPSPGAREEGKRRGPGNEVAFESL